MSGKFARMFSWVKTKGSKSDTDLGLDAVEAGDAAKKGGLEWVNIRAKTAQIDSSLPLKRIYCM